jgi:hypothetical protein
MLANGLKNGGTTAGSSSVGGRNGEYAPPAPVEVVLGIQKELAEFQRNSDPQELRAAMKIALQAVLNPAVYQSSEARQAVAFLERYGVLQAESDSSGFGQSGFGSGFRPARPLSRRRKQRLRAAIIAARHGMAF